jgi:branched-chain amino acid transport system ATP-binding protein
MLQIKGIDVFIEGMHILKDVNLEVQQGEFVSLIGANGAGKSTIMKTITGQFHPTKGEILYKEQNITKLRSNQICERHISIVPEGRMLFTDMSVEENLLMGAFIHRKDSARIRKNLERVYHIFPVLEQYKNRVSSTFSGGEQQMISIGRGLMSEPELLLVDELSLGLAPKVVTQLLKILRDLNQKEGLTILLVEQNAAQALKFSQRSYVLDNGRITLSGSNEELMSNPVVQQAYVGI